MIDDERIAEIRARHVLYDFGMVAPESGEWIASVSCRGCHRPWPCEPAEVLARLDALAAERDAQADQANGWRLAYESRQRKVEELQAEVVAKFQEATTSRLEMREAKAERDAAQALSAMTARKLTEQLDHAETLASRLAAAEAALEAENKALREFVLDAIDCLERLDGPRRPNTLGWSEEVRLALHALCKPLAAAGVEGQG